MDIDLSGKTAIIALRPQLWALQQLRDFAASGAMVVVNGRTSEAVDRVVKLLGALTEGAKVAGFAADLGDARGRCLVAEHPSCDILVDDLEIYGHQDFFEVSDSESTRFFDVNVMSGVRLSRALSAGDDQTRLGPRHVRIVKIGAEHSRQHDPLRRHQDRALPSHVALLSVPAGTGVTVNSVLPGPTLSEGVAEMLKDRKVDGQSLEETAAAFVEAHRPSSIIQRAASVEEVANMIVYVSSPQASATTGAALRVDGGVVDTIA